MVKYLINGSYTIEGTKGLLKEGGTRRQEMITNLIKNLGGNLEAFYYTIGKDDIVVIFEVPDRKSALALSMSVTASGSANVSLTELIDPSEIDEAVKITVGYRPPGD